MKWQAVNLAAPEFAQASEPPSLCGVIYTGMRHLASGTPEAAKTLFALIAGLELMRSGSGTFALIDFESGSKRMRLMLTELGASLEEIGRVYYVEEADGPPDNDDLQALLEHDVKLAIIDAAAGAYDASALDDNKRADTERFGRTWIDPLWKLGITTLLLDHVVKNIDARGKFAIGSERKAGRTDVHLGFEAVTQLTRGKNGLIRIATHKDRPGWLTRPRAAELELHSDPATHAITWTFRASAAETTGGEWKPTALMAKVVTYLATQTEPVNKTSIVLAVRGNKTYVIQAIDELVANGTATETLGPRNAKLIALESFPRAVPPVESGNRERVPSRSPSQSFPGTTRNDSEHGTAQTSIDEPEALELISEADVKEIESRMAREEFDRKRLR